MSGLQKNAKKYFSRWLFLKSILSVLRCTWTGRINLKIFLGYDINYLSIWPFMCHPWFPTIFSLLVDDITRCWMLERIFAYFNALETYGVVSCDLVFKDISKRNKSKILLHKTYKRNWYDSATRMFNFELNPSEIKKGRKNF